MQGVKAKDIPEALRTSVTEESQTPLEKTEAPDSSSREDPNEVFKETNEDEKMIPKAEKLEKKQEAKTSLVSATVTSADASSLSNVCATSDNIMQGVKVKDIPEALRTSVTEESQTPLKETEAPGSSSKEDPREVFSEIYNEDEKKIPEGEKLEKKQEEKTRPVTAAVTSDPASSFFHKSATSGAEILDMKMASSNGYSYSCPGCKALSTIPETQDNFFNFQNYSVILPDGTEIPFFDATTKYLDDYFPDHERESYEVPPACVYEQDESFDFVPDDKLSAMAAGKVKGNQQRGKGKRSPKDIMDERKAKNAVEKVASSFYSFGKEILGPMFVLKDFKFLNFARNSAAPKKQKTYPYHGDHDILIISLTKGVTFIQVKSVENTDTRTCWDELNDAFTTQLPKDEFAMKHMNGDLNFMNDLPMQKFVGVPNLTDKDLSDINLCSNHRQHTLTRDELKMEQLQKLLSEKFSQEENVCVLNIKDYKDLVSRYVGLLSSFKMNTFSKAIKKVGQKVARKLLNPDQLQCLRNNAKRNVILGHFGTGKSLLLMKKAEELAEKGEQVYVLSFSCVHDEYLTVNPKDMDNLVGSLQRMQASKNVVNKPVVESFIQHYGKGKSPKGECKVTPKMICDVIERSAKDGNVHYFLDELPLGVFSQKEDGWQELETFCTRNESMFMWIAISSYSIRPDKEKGFQFYEDWLPKSFEKTYLTQWMRVPCSVYELIQTVSDIAGENSGGLGSHGNSVRGPRHWWVELKECVCDNKKTPLKCSCVGPQRLRVVLHKVVNNLKGISLDDITILFHESSDEMKRFLTKATEDACKGKFPYKLCVHGLDDHSTLEEGPKPAITVGNIWSLKGNESKVLIFLDPFGGQILGNVGKQTVNRNFIPRFTLAASRCLAHFIIITWPQEEKFSFEAAMIDISQFNASDPNNPLLATLQVDYLVKDLLKGGEGEKGLMDKVRTANSHLIEKKLWLD